MTGTNKLPLGLRIVSELGSSTAGQGLSLLVTGRILVCATGAVKNGEKKDSATPSAICGQNPWMSLSEEEGFCNLTARQINPSTVAPP